VRRWIIVAATLLTTTHLRAQEVGVAPPKSPYEDLTAQSEIGFWGGWFFGSSGRAGVGLQDGPTFGVRYDRHFGGPAAMSVRFGVVSADRTVVNPALNPPGRTLGTQRETAFIFDGDFEFLVTGAKTWHGLVPLVHAGLGAQFDTSPPDIGGFSVGTGFALNVGCGVKYIPSPTSRFTLRFDFVDNIWQYAYPSSYYLIPGGAGVPVLVPGSATNQWTNNLQLTLGLNMVIGRAGK